MRRAMRAARGTRGPYGASVHVCASSRLLRLQEARRPAQRRSRLRLPDAQTQRPRVPPRLAPDDRLQEEEALQQVSSLEDVDRLRQTHIFVMESGGLLACVGEFEAPQGRRTPVTRMPRWQAKPSRSLVVTPLGSLLP